MKAITMEHYFENDFRGKEDFTRLSRWITVKTLCNPSKHNSLYDYAKDENGYTPGNENFNPNEVYIDYFTFGGVKYALDRFYRLGSMWICDTYRYTENGKTNYLSGVDMDGNIYDPLYIELDDYGEKVRVYKRA